MNSTQEPLAQRQPEWRVHCAALRCAVQADKDSSGSVTAEELADLLASHHRSGDFYKLMKRCPIDGGWVQAGRGGARRQRGWLLTRDACVRGWRAGLGEEDEGRAHGQGGGWAVQRGSRAGRNAGQSHAWACCVRCS